MRFEGTLAQWNDDRGFGFIQPTEGGEALFAHISAFPRDGQRPQLHERLSFEVTLGQGGKKQAVTIQRPGAAAPAPAQGRQRTPPAMARSTSTEGFGKLLVWLLVCAALGAGYWKYDAVQQQARAAAAEQALWNSAAPDTLPATPAPLAASPFRCDGRQHCSQMTSCAEAKFFLKNCPDPQMDGDGDGVPCEQQWCSSPFAK